VYTGAVKSTQAERGKYMPGTTLRSFLLIALMCVLGTAAEGQDRHDWQSLAQLQAGDKVRLYLKTEPVDGVFQNSTPQQVTDWTVIAKRAEPMLREHSLARPGGRAGRRRGLGGRRRNRGSASPPQQGPYLLRQIGAIYDNLKSRVTSACQPILSMLRALICGLLMAAGLITSSPSQTKLVAGYCTGFVSFGSKDSLNTADLRVEIKDLRMRVNAKGPELHLRLEPDPEWKVTIDAVQRVGWIRVLSCETGALLQSLEVKTRSGPEMLLRFFEAKAVNFDG
jgi:hypothetical protein